MLGVVVNLEEMPAKKILICNKAERVASLAELIQSIVFTRVLPKPLAAEVRGKIQFAAGQVHGRLAVGHMRALSDYQFKSHSLNVSDDLCASLQSLMIILTSGAPRFIGALGVLEPILVFSDGACEGQEYEQVSVGAVIVDTLSDDRKMFGGRVPEELVRVWKSESKLQTIGQAELLPAVLARRVIGEAARHRIIFFYIDNDSARMALIKGSSDSRSSAKLVELMMREEMQVQTWTWYARVPTHSNPGDGPSRLRLLPHEENLFAKPVDCPEISVAVFAP